MALQLVSAGFILLFAYPSYKKLIDNFGKRGWGIIVGLGVFALGFEYAALLTGWPYGGFKYGELLGPKIMGILPIPIAWAWAPMVIGVASWGARLSKRFPLVLALTLLILVDVVVDPGAVATKMWSYNPEGSFYGVPLSNFAGWVFSGLVGISITYLFVKPSKLAEVKPETSLKLILITWSMVALIYGMWIPFLIGVGLLWKLKR